MHFQYLQIKPQNSCTEAKLLEVSLCEYDCSQDPTVYTTSGINRFVELQKENHFHYQKQKDHLSSAVKLPEKRF